MPLILDPPATQSEIDLAITTLRGNGCEGITGDMIIATVAEQRIIDATAGSPMLDKSKWTGADSVTPPAERALALLRDLVSASDANDQGSVLNCIEDARELLAEADGSEGDDETELLAEAEAEEVEDETDNLWRCGACGHTSDEEFERCPDCGVPDQCYEVS